MNMDPLTPNKIKRLIHLAEDRSFSNLQRNDFRALNNPASSTANYESSSGILDLDKIEGFGESMLDGGESFSRSTAFRPGEMTGRSTEADSITSISSKSMPHGRHSLALESLTNEMNKQSDEVADVIRHSIATDYSFHSKRDLTADEASFVRREAPLPIQPNTQTYFTDSMSVNNSNVSVGAYFKNKCPEFNIILAKTDSPDRSAWMPSITEVSSNDSRPSETSHKYTMDESLDCVPVRQARDEKTAKINDVNSTKNYENYNIPEPPKINFGNNATYDKETKVEDLYCIDSLNLATSSNAQNQSYALNPGKLRNPFASKPTDLFLKTLQASMKLNTEDTEGTEENSLSISKIADYLKDKHSMGHVSVTDLMQITNPKKIKKQPLTELHMNIQENTEQDGVTNLRDSKKMDTTSSAGTINTVISNKAKNKEGKIPKVIPVPSVVVSHHTIEDDDVKTNVRSKSPSSKSQSTMSTVQDNYMSFKSGDSPVHSGRGDVNASHVPSPNIEYRELDKSIDWREVLRQKQVKQDSLVKEQWAEISASPVDGFVGISSVLNISISNLTEDWLTAKFQFQTPDDITIELPRLPLLLTPGKTEKYTVQLISNIEFNQTIPYTVAIKDSSLDREIEQNGDLDVIIKMPLIQAMSCDGVNKVVFPLVQENSSSLKSFVLISDCPADLQLDLSVESDGVFTMKSVQEIKRGDVNKVLMDGQSSSDDQKRSKGLCKQLCRLSSGNAIRVTIKFNAPKLSESQIAKGSVVAFNGTLNVNLIGVNTTLRKVDLQGNVGMAKLVIRMPLKKLHLTNESTNISLTNGGTVSATWCVRLTGEQFPFKLAPTRFEIPPGGSTVVALSYTGPEDDVTERKIYFEDVNTGNKTPLEISGGTEKFKTFPIKTNHNVMSWVRSGRKDLSLKNSASKMINVRCYIVGQGFSIDLPGAESGGMHCLSFAPNECRQLSVIFAPSSNEPNSATLHLAYDKNSEICGKIKLYGCSRGDKMMQWCGVATYGDTALVRPVAGAPITVDLFNKSTVPMFVYATVQFNLQYSSISPTARLVGSRKIVSGRSRHALRLCVDWARVELRARCAGTLALATITVLTGAELTRRRILRVIRDEPTGQLDLSLLDEHLKFLAGPFEGEHPGVDRSLADFSETKSSLSELIGGIHELTALIGLHGTDDETIIIPDETIIEHHTLLD